MFAVVVACLASATFSSDSQAVRFGEFEIHPSLGLTERFTDNVFNTDTDRESDFSTVISPGVQIIFPRSKKRYELELIYQADVERFNTFTSENAVSHKAAGRFEIRFPVGLEFVVNDEFNRGHDPRGLNISPELDFFDSNLGRVSAAYNLSDRFKLRFDLTNFILRYDADRNEFRNRTDNGVSGYLYYRFLPKTAAFIEYDYLVVNYAQPSDLNSKEHHLFGGVTWDITGKTKGTVKVGYGTKDFKDPTVDGYGDVVMEITIDHNFSTRDSLRVGGIRSTNETNNPQNDFFVTTGLSLEYLHKFTGKITGKAYLSYGRDSYRGEQPRRDDTWEGRIGLIYQIKNWLRAEAGYSHTDRSSTIETYSYPNNTYYLKVVATP